MPGVQLTKENFFSRTQTTPTGCVKWLGSQDKDGYGWIRCQGHRKAHRAAYSLFVGPIPPGLLVCHKCDNTSCVNPKHLFLGTVSDNLQDAISKGRIPRLLPQKFCKLGLHKLNADNIKYSKSGRRCRQCDNNKWMERYYKRKNSTEWNMENDDATK